MKNKGQWPPRSGDFIKNKINFEALIKFPNTEIKKLFNLFEGPVTITKILNGNNIKPKDKKTTVVNTVELRP